MRLILNDFSRMTGKHVLGGKGKDKHGNIINSYHRDIIGFTPHYADLADESNDANLHKKVNPSYPLVMTPALDSIGTISGVPIILLANQHNAGGKLIYCTTDWFFGFEDGDTTQLSIPDGSIHGQDFDIDAVVFNDHILTAHTEVSELYHGEIDSTPSWTGFGTIKTGPHILKNFQDRCLVTDGSDDGAPRTLIRVVLSGWSVVAGLDLGDTFDIRGVGIFQDRAVLAFCRKTTAPKSVPVTDVFIWDGVPGNQYDQHLVLRGSFRYAIEKDGIVYAFTQRGPSLICYAFDGAGFREIGSLGNILIPNGLGITKNRISVEGDFFAMIALRQNDLSIPRVLYWNPFTGEAFWPLIADPFDPGDGGFVSLLLTHDPLTGIYDRYFGYWDSTNNGVFYKLELEDASNIDTAEYHSNIIPAPSVKDIHEDGEGRMQINQIEIEYNKAPPTSADSIDLTLTTKDALESETYSAQTATIGNNNTNSTNATVDATRAIIQLGANATEFSIDLSVTADSDDWGLIIRRIIVDYEPIALQN